MSRKRAKRTNEWEFQGELLKWLNDEIRRRQGMGLEKATQEPPKIRLRSNPKRSDLVVWVNRDAEQAFLAFEIKTPDTPISDPGLFSDAWQKAQAWGAPYFAIWNMQAAELYRTPPPGTVATPNDCIHRWATDPLVGTVDDWLQPIAGDSLARRGREILDRAWQTAQAPSAHVAIEASIFVERLAQHLTNLRSHLTQALSRRTAKDARARRELREMAAAQGYLGFVDDLHIAAAGQYAYRLIGQILFYFALRRRQPALRPLCLTPTDTLPQALRPFWDDVRRFDYEALFQPTALDELVPMPPAAQNLVRDLISNFQSYDWNNLRDDVLGSIFERLIPIEEQILLGQFYTPPRVADLITAFTISGDRPKVLDPGCGSGTFLMRAYDYLRARIGSSHDELLSTLWGFDISPFAAELAAINLFRQDLSAFNNFPRIVAGDFFERRPGESIPFPPARTGGQKLIPVPIPQFDAVVGNPPYLRSQNQDDLSKAYKARLIASAVASGIDPPAKTDLFAFFVYHALQFLGPEGRLGFVTSSSWLTADFGATLQRLLFDRLRLVALVSSTAESFFPQVDINTVLVIAERRPLDADSSDELLRFVTMKRKLSDLFTSEPAYWEQVLRFTDSIESTKVSFETADCRVTVVSVAEERSRLETNRGRQSNWSLYLRAPLSYFELFGT